MEINNKSPLIDLGNSADRLHLQEQIAQRVQTSSRGSVAEDPDRVELSVRSRAIQNLGALIQSTPDIRDAVVQRVQQSLQNGTYNVKAEQVADKILGGNLVDEIF